MTLRHAYFNLQEKILLTLVCSPPELENHATLFLVFCYYFIGRDVDMLLFLESERIKDYKFDQKLKNANLVR